MDVEGGGVTWRDLEGQGGTWREVEGPGGALVDKRFSKARMVWLWDDRGSGGFVVGSSYPSVGGGVGVSQSADSAQVLK